MARTRNIKPAFFDNDILGGLDPLTRLLFIGLWCIADREGRLEDRPLRIKKTLLGYDDVTAEEANGMLQQLAESGFITRYTVDDTAYIQIDNFSKHQNPNMKEKESEIPPPPGCREQETPNKHSESTVPAPNKNEEKGDPTPADADAESDDQPPSTETLLEKRFDTFWEAYPNKKAKQNAIKAWKKIKPNTALFEKIMKAVDLQKRSEDWQRENGRYIPYPATWLNGGYWDNEIKEVRDDGRHDSDRRTGSSSDVGAAFQRRKGGNGTPAGFKSE